MDGRCGTVCGGEIGMICPNCNRKMVEVFLTAGCDWCDFGPQEADYARIHSAFGIVYQDDSEAPLVFGNLYLLRKDAYDDSIRIAEILRKKLKVAEILTFTRIVYPVNSVRTDAFFEIYPTHKCPIDKPFAAWQYREPK